MKLVSGEQLGDYTLRGPIGSGGMAEVWAAAHPLLGIEVALKILLDRRPQLQARLKREGRAQASVHHPNILPVRDIFEADGTLVLVLPLVEGPSLAALLQHHRLDEAGVVGLFAAIVEGVDHAHSQGLIHRDLKPANVLLGEQRGRIVPRVADFGLVKALAEEGETRSGVMMGTPRYAAPEQLLDAAATDVRADLYSLGVMFVEMLTGDNPFPRGSLASLIRAQEDGPDLSAVSPRWQPLCRSLLAPRPDDRPESCATILRALRQLALPAEQALRVGSPLARAVREARIQELPKKTPAAETVMESEATWSQGSQGSGTFLEETHAAPENNLPAERDVFFGREALLVSLSEELQRGQLVSLMGFGGSGKTRLALRYAHQQLHDYPGGVWFVDLSQAHSAEDIVATTANVLGISARSGLAEQIGHAIAGRGRCLMLFDNFEQVADAAEDTVGRWMASAPLARLIVTSRVVLSIAGEQGLFVEPMEADEARALFVERARTRKITFQLTEQNRGAVDALVEGLDRLPLAIELVAARIRLMSPQQMLKRMGQRFKLLSVGRGGTNPRQATLRGTIDWSWGLLADWEQSALVQCAVFEGGFTLEAASAVLDLDHFDPAPWPMDAVQSLVDKSLLRVLGENRQGEMRFGMLVSIHEYARERCRALSAEVRQALEHRHVAFFAQLSGQYDEDALSGRSTTEDWWALAAEVENIQAAIRAAARDTLAESLLMLCAGLRAVARRQRLRSGSALLEDVWQMPAIAASPAMRAQLVLQRGDEHYASERWEQELADCREALVFFRSVNDRVSVGRVLLQQGSLQQEQARYETGLSSLSEAIDIFRSVGNRYLEGRALTVAGRLYRRMERPDDALEVLQAALVIFRQQKNRTDEAHALSLLGQVYHYTARYPKTLEAFHQALRIHRDSGHRRHEANTLGNLGSVYVALAQPQKARRHLEASLVIHRELGDRRFEGITLGNLASISRMEGRYEEALANHREALQIHRAAGSRHSEAVALNSLGRTYQTLERWDEALAHAQEALAAYQELGNRRGETFATVEIGTILRELGRHDEAIRALTTARESFQGLGDVIGQGYALFGVGVCFLARGDAAMGRQTLDEAEALVHTGDVLSATVALICRRTQASARYGDIADAKEALARVRALAARLEGGEEATRHALERAEQALNTAAGAGS